MTSVSSFAGVLLVQLILFLYCDCHETAALNGLVPSATSRLDFDFLLSELRASHEVEINRRSMVENSSNTTDFCQHYYYTKLVQQVNDTCLYSLSNLDVTNATYLASDDSVKDVSIVCNEDCAGVFLEYNETCPGYITYFSALLRGVCSKNSHHERCAFATLENDGSRVYQKCFVETNAFERCRNRCKNALYYFSTDLDCCINTFYNDTFTFFIDLQYNLPDLNYSIDPLLWDTCGIPYPNECSSNLFPLPYSTTPVIMSITPTPTPSPTLTPLPSGICMDVDETAIFSDSCLSLLSEFQTQSGVQRIASNGESTRELCSMECAGNYVQQCNKLEAGKNASTILGLFCGQYNNEYCGGLIADSYSMLLQNLSLCEGSSYSSSDFSCTTECQSALIAIGVELGCCVYVLTQNSVSERAGTPLLESLLWSSCGLDPPQQCPDPFPSDVEERITPNKGRGMYVPRSHVTAILFTVTCSVY